MTIRIAAKLHPFSHLPGTLCLLPQTHLKVQIFPTRVQFSDLYPNNLKNGEFDKEAAQNFCLERMTIAERQGMSEDKNFDAKPTRSKTNFSSCLGIVSLAWDIQGPIKEFTVEMDLEKQQVIVFGMTKSGYMRYRLQRQDEGITIILDKIPDKTINCHLSHPSQTYQLSRGEILHIPSHIPRAFLEMPPAFSEERLSLGMHKAQDWQLIKRRLDLKEIFPLWMRLGQMTPPIELPSSTKGNLKLLHACTKAVEEENKNEIISAFTALFLAGFEGMCVPRLLDTDYQGLTPFEPASDADPSPMAILTHGAFLIRSLFFQETEGSIALLPCVPADFHAGRMLEINTLLGDRIDFEWSKKQLRTVILQPGSERALHLKLPRVLRSCRVRTSSKERGKEYAIKEGCIILEISPGAPLFIDRFQK